MIKKLSVGLCLYAIYLYPLCASALPAVLAIENPRLEKTSNIPSDERKTLHTDCKPVALDIYLNDELADQLKNDLGMKTNQFFTKTAQGNKISYTYFPESCRTQAFKNTSDANGSALRSMALIQKSAQEFLAVRSVDK